MALEPGRLVDGKYRVIRQLGAGGMGAVYLAEDEGLGREVALKVIHEAAQGESFRSRFAREARVLGQIGPPHAVTVFAYGVDPDGLAWIAMEVLDGESLGDRLRRTPRLSPAELRAIFPGLIQAVAALHARRILHRDLKPDNIFLLREPGPAGAVSVRLLDFGIAKLETADADMTRTHAGMGTPAYAAPEQLSNAKAVDARADVYSLSVLLYQCLVGALPYDVDSITELVMRMYTEGPRPALEVAPGAPSALARLADAGLAVNPDHRLPSVAEFERMFAEAVAQELGGDGLATPPTAPAAGGSASPQASRGARAAQVAVALPGVPATPQRSSRAPLALALVGLALSAVGAYMLLRDGDSPPPANAAAASTAPQEQGALGAVAAEAAPPGEDPVAEGSPTAAAEATVVLRPDSVRASRHLSGEGNYPPANAFDGTDNTGWAVRRAVPGEDFLEALFDQPVHVQRVRLATGYTRFSRSAGDLFVANDHLRRARLVTDAGDVEFDVGEEQRHIEVQLPGLTRSVKLVVLSVWPGDRWRDLTITEVEVLGRPRAP